MVPICRKVASLHDYSYFITMSATVVIVITAVCCASLRAAHSCGPNIWSPWGSEKGDDDKENGNYYFRV